MTRVAAVILAAGGSSRMGRPKQLLPYRGQSLLRRAAAVAGSAGCDPVAIVLGAGSDRLRPELAGANLTVIENPEWADGPGTSVRAGVRAVWAADAVVFLVCDQPLVNACHVRRLIDVWRSTGLPMAASGYAGTVGVPAVFARDCFAALESLPAAAGAKQLLARQPGQVAIVPFPAGEVDLDTPDDYERLIAVEPQGVDG